MAPEGSELLLLANIVTTSKAPVTTSVALVSTSVLVTTSKALVTSSDALVPSSFFVTTSKAPVTTSVALVSTSVLVTTQVAAALAKRSSKKSTFRHRCVCSFFLASDRSPDSDRFIFDIPFCVKEAVISTLASRKRFEADARLLNLC